LSQVITCMLTSEKVPKQKKLTDVTVPNDNIEDPMNVNNA